MKHTALEIGLEKTEESLIHKRGYTQFAHHILIVGDLVFLNAAFLLAYYLRFRENPFTGLHDHFPGLLIVCNLTWIVNVYLLNIYAITRVSNWETIIWNVFKALTFHAFIVSFYILSVKGYYYSRFFILLNYSLLAILIFAWRTVFVAAIKSYWKSGNGFGNVVIVGANKASFKIYNYFLKDKSHGYHLKAVFGDFNGEPQKGDVAFLHEERLFDYLATEKPDEIYCALPLTQIEEIRNIMSYAENNLIRFRYVPDFRALLYKKLDIEFYGLVPVLSVRNEPLENVGKRFAKRTFDIVFSVLALMVLVPFVFPVLAVLIRLSSPGPVFFKQKRSGRDNKVFHCLKFRTMQVNELADSVQATQSDSRITPVGKFLRKTNLDELPQFFNVLTGEMSVVGPRPHMIKHTELYKQTIDKFMIRHLIKPGITGWAQVNGFRGNTETPQKMIKRARYDVWYIENWSLFLDFKIIVMTILNMIKGEKNAF